jgi:NADPH:quinone reductase-like Zn-dependent oxidoreductase
MVVSVVGPDLGAPQGGSSVFFVVEPHPAQLRELAGLVEAGRVRPMVGKVVSLADGPQGLSAKGAGGIPGKVVWEVP